MTSKILLAFVFCSLSVQSFADGAYDLLDQKTTIALKTQDPAPILDQTLTSMKSMLKRFVPRLEQGSTLTFGPKVTGTEPRPVLKMVLNKCLALVLCKTVPFYGEVTVTPTKGSCVRNFDIDTNLEKSGSPLADSYDSIKMSLCLDSAGTLNVSSLAHRARTYVPGTMQQQILHSLQLQIAPLAAALKASLYQTMEPTAGANKHY